MQGGNHIASDVEHALVLSQVSAALHSKASRSLPESAGIKYKVYVIDHMDKHCNKSIKGVRITFSNIHRIASKCKHVVFLSKNHIPCYEFYINTRWMQVPHVLMTNRTHHPQGSSEVTVRAVTRFVTTLISCDETCPVINPNIPLTLEDAVARQVRPQPAFYPDSPKDSGVSLGTPGASHLPSCITLETVQDQVSADPLEGLQMGTYAITPRPSSDSDPLILEGDHKEADDDERDEEPSDWEASEAAKTLGRCPFARTSLKKGANRFVLTKNFKGNRKYKQDPITKEACISDPFHLFRPASASSCDSQSSCRSGCRDSCTVQSMVVHMDKINLATEATDHQIQVKTQRRSAGVLKRSASLSSNRKSAGKGLSTLRLHRRHSRQSPTTIDATSLTPIEGALVEVAEAKTRLDQKGEF